MKLPIIKRKIKYMLQSRSEAKSVIRGKISVPISIISFGVLVFVLVLFCLTQLLVVSVLSPRGAELKRLDYEKEVLLEENRKIEHEIAEFSSIDVVRVRSEDELDMNRAENVLYLDTPEARADLSSQSEND